ncbi:MAG TPA: MFS transporter [Thermoanaerobaculia bacterium]|nr:MFS transporter [Thermoanaerobaculia bacterium]
MNEAERRIASLSPQQRELLMRKMRERGGPRAAPRTTEIPKIPEGPVDRYAPVPPTDFQEALWLSRSGVFDLGGSGANVYLEYEFPGIVWQFATLFNDALRALIERHEMLRTILLPDGHLQLLAEVPPFEVEIDDLSGKSPEEIAESLRKIREELRYAKRPLDRWPLFEIVLHQLGEGRIRLHARFDLILIDGAARGVLLSELVRILNFPDQPLPELDISFLDHARALAAFRETETYARARAYWMERLPHLPPPPVLPLARPLAPEDLPRAVKREPEVLPAEDWKALCVRAAKAGITPTTAVTAAFAEVLRLWSAAPDFSVGFGGTYRPPIHPHIERTLGSFTIIHLLAFEDGPGSFLDRARRLQDRVTADLDHQEVSGHQVLREYNRLHRVGARSAMPIQLNSVVEHGRNARTAAPASPEAPAPEDGAAPAPQPQILRIDLTEVDLLASLPQVLLFWVALENLEGGLSLVSQAVEEVFPENLVPAMIEAYRGLVTRLATDEAAWREDRPARFPAGPDVPPAATDEPIPALGYGAHPRFVESALEQHPSLSEARVAWRSEGEGRGRLIAWIVPRPGRPPSAEALRRHLRAAGLPAHLVPDSFTFLERLPRTADGAVDPGALPAPAPAAAPTAWGKVETELAALWEEVLGQRPTALDDDFFLLGGSSVTAVRLLARITRRWGRDVDPGELFARPTLAGLAAAIQRSAGRSSRPLQRLATWARGSGSRLLQLGPRLVTGPTPQEGDMARRTASYGLRMYIMLLIGQTVSALGTGLGTFALGVWLFQQTKSVTQFSGLMLASVITGLLLAPVAGSVADRFDRRRVMLLSNLASATLTLLLATALWQGFMRVEYSYVMAVGMTCIGVLSGPAFIASVSTLVPRHLLVRMNSTAQTSMTITAMIAPLLAGFLVGKISYHGVIFIDFCTFLFASFTVFLVRIPRPPASPESGRANAFYRDILVGFSYVKARPGLLSLLLLFGISNFTIGTVQVLLTPLILSFATPEQLGTVNSAAAAGLFLGGLFLSLWGGPRRLVWSIFGALIAQGLILFLGGLEPNLPLVTGAVFAFMLTGPFVGNSSQAIWQSKVPLDLQGRVFAVRSLVATGSLPLAYSIAGPLADKVFEPMLSPGGLLAGTVGQVIGVGDGRGVGFLFMLLGALILISTLLFFLNPRLRNVETELPDARRPDEPQATPPASEAAGPEPSAAAG